MYVCSARVCLVGVCVCCSADQISLRFPSYSNKGMAARQPSHITSHQASRERARDIERRRGRDRARRRREFGGRKLCWQYYISRQPSPTAHINVVRHSEVMSISHKWQGRWRCGIQQWFLKAIVIYNGEHYEQMSPKKPHTYDRMSRLLYRTNTTGTDNTPEGPFKTNTHAWRYIM